MIQTKGKSPLYPGAPSYSDAESVLDDLGIHDPLRWRSEIWVATNSATTAPGLHGLSAMTAVGTASANSSFLGPIYTSAATAGSMASLRTASPFADGGVIRFSTGPESYGTKGSTEALLSMSFGLGRGSLAYSSDGPIRFFAGLRSANSAPVNEDPLALSAWHIGLVKGEADNQLSIISSHDGGRSVIPTGLTAEVANYHLVLHFSSPDDFPVNGTPVSKVRWYLSKIPVNAVGPQLPVDTVQKVSGVIDVFRQDISGFLYPSIWASNNADAKAVSIRAQRIMMARRMP